MHNIQTFMSWNDFQCRLSSPYSLLHRPLNIPILKIWMSRVFQRITLTNILIPLPYVGNHHPQNNTSSETAMQNYHQLANNWRRIFRFAWRSDTKAIKRFVVYEFKFPGCNSNYIGKSDRCLYTRIKEHSSQATSEIYNHIITCNKFN